MSQFTIIGKLGCSSNDIKVECDTHDEMVHYRDKMLMQGYTLVINQKPTQAEREACFREEMEG